MSDHIPKFSTRLWSEEVGMADAIDPLPHHDPGYEFSNGRKFRDGKGPYDNHGHGHHYVDVEFSIATRQAQGSAGAVAAKDNSVDFRVIAGQSQTAIAAAAAAVAAGVSIVRTTQAQANAGAAAAVIPAGVSVVRTASVGGSASGTSAVSGTGTGPSTGIDIFPAQPAIATGSQITTLTVENTSASTVTNQPFTIGHVFAKGHLPAAGAAISLVMPNNTAIPAQLDVKALHSDGSVRHALVSAVVPSIPASSSVVLSMKRVSTPAAGASVGFPAVMPSATINIGGTVYTAAPTPSDPYMTWFAGPVASDFVFNAALKDAGGNPHRTLKAQLSVRAFATGHSRVDYVLEDCQAYTSNTDTTYDATLYANGQPVYTRTGLVHTPTARWKRTFWQGAKPSLHIRHDIDYLIASRQVPNYQRITISEALLAAYANDLATNKFDPMGFGRLTPAMGTTGGRSDIGIMPDTHVATVLSMDPRAKAIALATADIGGSWPMCRRDDTNSPGRGYPLSVINYPYASLLGNPGDCINPATGKNEKLPALTTVSKGGPDSAHQPDIYYLPYLLTGDLFYLEGLHFCCTFNTYQDNPYYRDFAKGHFRSDQLRGQGWSMRTLAECAAITPDDHYLKPHFTSWLNNNVSWYNARYTDGNDNPLGIITNGSTVVYSLNGGTTNGIAPWQDDFFTQGVGHVFELLGLDTVKRLLVWKAKFQIGRMNDPAVCVQDACTYELGVRTTNTAPWFGSLAECFSFTVSAAMQQYACNSAQRVSLYSGVQPGDISGYPASTEGYPSNYQPALAYAVDSGYAGGADAWAKFMARPTKPDYSTGPQFAIKPRTVTEVGVEVRSTVTYSASAAAISNPERGFYVHILHGGDFSSANLGTYKAQGMTMVLYHSYLSAYVNAPLDNAFLSAFQSNVNAIRAAGMKTVLRFAYSSTSTTDATLARVQGHLDQLASYLAANSDVILGMPCGWVGQWGEFQGSTNFGTDSWPPNLSTANRAARKAVIDKALAVMPANRFVQVRQPWIKMDSYGSAPLDDSSKFSGSAPSRIGHFNDCFLSGSTDSGTYWQQASEEAFLSADTRFVPMGGETCTFNEPRSSGATALTEMARFHWSFCNSGYNESVITSWKNSGDYATIAKSLGYRLRLASGVYQAKATRGSAMVVTLNLVNDGFAAPFAARTAKLVLRNTATGAETLLPLSADPRNWQPGASTVTESVVLPTTMAAGSYALLLALPDAASNLASNPAYAIQLANSGVWEPATGYNLLGHTVTVS